MSIQRLSNIEPPFKLSKKLDGKNKKNFEIVVARYDEKLLWCENYREYLTIYNKGEDDIDYPYIKLENKGHLADTILRHIIDNYNNLADVTFFTHGSFNYRPDQIIKESGKCKKLFEDFISCEPNTLVYITRKNLPKENDTFYNYPDTAGNIYKRIFNEKYIRNFEWGCGKWISVSREKIHNSPIEVYKKMLEFVLSDFEGKEPSQDIYRTRGIFIERFILKAFMKKVPVKKVPVKKVPVKKVPVKKMPLKNKNNMCRMLFYR